MFQYQEPTPLRHCFNIKNRPLYLYGINGTDWIKIDRATNDACLDSRDYRPKPKK